MVMRVVMVTPTGMAEEYEVRHVRFDTFEEALRELHDGRIVWVKPEVAETLFEHLGMKRREYIPT